MLVVTLHDVSPLSLPVMRRMREALASWGVPRLTHLAVPNFHGRAPLDGSPETTRFLRECLDAGDEVALHGHYHQQRHTVAGAQDRLRAAVFTAGEGECLTATAPEIAEMMAGRERLQQLTGRPVPGFVAPAWLEPVGFSEHLRRAGFSWHEGSLWVERLGATAAEDRRAFVPVIGFATRSLARLVAALMWARGLAPLVNRLPVAGGRPVRLALHPDDWSSPAVVRATEEVVRRLVRRHEAVTTSRALLGDAPGGAQ